jgi:hypothetical protein
MESKVARAKGDAMPALLKWSIGLGSTNTPIVQSSVLATVLASSLNSYHCCLFLDFF